MVCTVVDNKYRHEAEKCKYKYNKIQCRKTKERSGMCSSGHVPQLSWLRPVQPQSETAREKANINTFDAAKTDRDSETDIQRYKHQSDRCSI